jgi:UDP-N-acetylglucosamine acyltransferase
MAVGSEQSEKTKLADIHPTAIIHSGAHIGVGVKIGPYCIVGEDVVIGDYTRCHAHVNLDGHTTIGSHCEIFPFASLGTIPQDLKFDGEQTQLIIGDYNRIREHVTMNPGTAGDKGVTRVGNHGLFMVGSHVAHDCVVGDHVIMANNATIAGHVTLSDRVILGGLSGVHQFVTVGERAMIGFGSMVSQDVVPYAMVRGERAVVVGLNRVGLRRSGYASADINQLANVYQILFGANEQGTLRQRVSSCRAAGYDNALIDELLCFAGRDSKRGMLKSSL